MKMDFKKLLTRENLPQVVLGVVSALYILGDIKPPQDVAGLVKTPIGMFVLAALAIMVGYHSHAIVAVLFAVAAYELYHRGTKHHIRGTEQKLPRDKRQPHLNPEVQFPVTLEEQVVKKMAPWVLTPNATPASYKPVMDSELDGSNL